MKTLAVAVLISLVVLTGCGPGGPLEFLSPTSAPPVVDSFDASPLTISPGGSSTLTWRVSGATAVSIDNGIGTVALSGSRVVSPTVTTVYTLVATNSGGKSVTATAQLTVSGTAPSPTGVPLVTSFVANPPIISSGDSATLNWEVSGSTSVAITPGVGGVASSGSTSVSPSTSTTYTLTATNAAGNTIATALVTVAGATAASPPVIDHFAFDPPEIYPGESTTLSWDVSGATTVVIDRGIGEVPSYGSQTVSVLATTNYTLTATNAEGSVALTVPITVGAAPDDARPDLVVTSIAKESGSGGYRIGYTIENRGEGPCPATVAKLYVNGVYKASDGVSTINAGAEVEGVFSSWTYDPRTPVIKVVADADDDAYEDDEDNNEKSVSIAVETVVNYVDTANLADWETGSPTTSISFGGSLSDPNGFAVNRTNVKLEDGDTYTKVLETHPKWVASGWIAAEYPAITVPLGAWFVADVGFLDGAAGTDGVQFWVWFMQSGVDIAEPVAHLDATYDGDLDRFELNLSSLAGRTGSLIFQVLAGPSSGKDWAVWANAKMIR